MDIKKILLISLIAVAIVASVSAVSAGLFDGLFGGEESQDNAIEIDHITFNTTNVTKFELLNSSEESGASIDWYVDENDTGYNVYIGNLSGVVDAEFPEMSDAFKEGQGIESLPTQTVNGIVVYTASANSGKHVGEARYISYVENRDLDTFVEFSSPDPNETAKMVSTLDFK